jgi:adenine C2-methylase RlmN of 23S rRNA A2503 and tRNA A37
MAFAEYGIKRSHCPLVWKHLTRNPGLPIDSVPNIPALAKEILRDKFTITTSRLVSSTTSRNGSTTKLLIELQDGHRVESVIIRYDKDSDKDVTEGGGESRITLCVSSQIGCQMGCTFCATGTMGLLGNLTGGEICEQLYHANTIEKIDNIVFMGMGEPLSNYDSVLSAIRGMTDANRFNLANYRITLSTVGIVPKMYQITHDMPSVHLALSLHAPTQEMRQLIVPSARAFKLDAIIEALDDHLWRTGRAVLIEYVLLAGVNDAIDTAHLLGQLLKGKKVKVNLIPYNQTTVCPSCPMSLYMRSLYDLCIIVMLFAARYM